MSQIFASHFGSNYAILEISQDIGAPLQWHIVILSPFSFKQLKLTNSK